MDSVLSAYQLKGLYTMFGYDEGHEPFAAMNVTAEQARGIAEVKGLTGFFLAPHWNQFPNSGGMRSYKWNKEGGRYEGWTVRGWTFNNLLDQKEGYE